MREAMSACALDAGNMAAVAVHGTGTPLGDPIEVGALGVVLGGNIAAMPLLLVASKAHPFQLVRASSTSQCHSLLRLALASA